MSNPKVDNFSKQIDAFVAKVSRRADRYLESFILQLAYEVIAESPTITGALKSQWHVRNQGEGEPQQYPEDPTGGSARSRVLADIGKLKAGSIVYVANNVRAKTEGGNRTGQYYARLVEFTNVRYGVQYPGRFPSQGFTRRAMTKVDTFHTRAVQQARTIK